MRGAEYRERQEKVGFMKNEERSIKGEAWKARSQRRVK
jgi:hypothetical protein